MPESVPKAYRAHALWAGVSFGFRGAEKAREPSESPGPHTASSGSFVVNALTLEQAFAHPHEREPNEI